MGRSKTLISYKGCTIKINENTEAEIWAEGQDASVEAPWIRQPYVPMGGKFTSSQEAEDWAKEFIDKATAVPEETVVPSVDGPNI